MCSVESPEGQKALNDARAKALEDGRELVGGVESPAADQKELDPKARQIVSELTLAGALLPGENEGEYVLLDKSGYAGIYIGSINGKTVDNEKFTLAEGRLRRSNSGKASLALSLVCRLNGIDTSFWNEARVELGGTDFARSLLQEVAGRSGFVIDLYETLDEPGEMMNEELLKYTDSWKATITTGSLIVRIYNGWMRGVWGIEVAGSSQALAKWDSDQPLFWWIGQPFVPEEAKLFVEIIEKWHTREELAELPKLPTVAPITCRSHSK